MYRQFDGYETCINRSDHLFVLYFSPESLYILYSAAYFTAWKFNFKRDQKNILMALEEASWKPGFILSELVISTDDNSKREGNLKQ